MENISCDLSAWLLPETLHTRICHEITKSSVKWIETRGGAPDRWELEVIAMRGLHQQGWHRLFKSHCLVTCMNNTTDLNYKQDGCTKGILFRLINSCCETAQQLLHQTQQPDKKVKKFPISDLLCSLRLLLLLQLSWTSNMSLLHVFFYVIPIFIEGLLSQLSLLKMISLISTIL